MRLYVEVDKIRPNPFRNFENQPIQQDKVDRLVESIKSTGFWDNIMVRPAPGCCIEYSAHDTPEDATLCNERWFSFETPDWPHGEYDVVTARCVGFEEFSGDDGDDDEQGCSKCEFRRYPRDVETCVKAGCDFFEDYCEESLGFFELAYGHHRLEALKQLGIKSVEIECKILSDEKMLKIMAADNLMGL